MKLFPILFINESFTYPPRDRDLFFSLLSKRIEDYKTKITNYKNLFFFGNSEDEISDKQYVLDGTIRQTTELNFDSYDLKYPIQNLMTKLRDLSGKDILRMSEEFKTQNRYYQGKYLSWMLQPITFFIEDLDGSINRLKKLNEFDYVESYNEYYSSTYPEFKEIVIAIKSFIKDSLEFYEYIIFAAKKLEKLTQIFNSYSDTEILQNTEKEETLYHATVNARELFKNGFRKNFNQSVEGIGGANADKSGNPSVSFTSDLYVAKEIMRCLKEAIMIAKGQLDIYDIKTWAKQEKIDDKIIETFGEEFSDEMLEKTKTLPTKKVFDYYRYYLTYSKRYNPVFVDTNDIMSVFKNKSVDDVGILVCKVDMTDPNILYYSSMEEYRVSPNSVIEITKILSS